MRKARGTALVTGGAVRIGRAISEALADEGYGVVIHCDRSLEAAQNLAAAIRRRPGRAWVVCGALDGEDACRAIMKAARRLAGRIDVLVNNAAVFHKQALEACTEEALRSELQINLLAPVLLTRLFGQQTRRGCVVNLLDRRLTAHDATCIPYLLSKKALAEFTHTAALAMAPGIRVNAVAPGAVLPPPGKGMEYLHDSAGRMPLGRRLVPRHIADAVVMLTRLEQTTGQVVFVDGGQHLLGNAV